ncbi:MAG: MaoC/PaaZ C-terminal domain-containing protein [bacterium]|nr:MaoC/PaaZ C-terminal domain-containing protein [bacterium]
MSYAAGDALPDLVKDPIGRVQLVKYAGASGDFNPLHFDDSVAQERGLDQVIAHGMLSMAFLGQAAESAFGAGSIRKLEVNFRGMVRLGDVITCRGEVTEVREQGGRRLAVCALEAVNQEGAPVTKGTAEAWLTD